MNKQSKAEALLDFEITFYEKLVNRHPDFVDALIPLAEAYTRKGKHEDGLAIDQKLTQLRKTDPIAWYNLACSYSLLDRLEESFHSLKKAFDFGYRDWRHLRRDPDLKKLRNSGFYSELLQQYPLKPLA